MLGRLATTGRDGQPHVVPVAFRYNPDEDTIDIGGHGFAQRKKFRDVQQNPRRVRRGRSGVNQPVAAAHARWSVNVEGHQFPPLPVAHDARLASVVCTFDGETSP
jgi:hypothetical protein